MKMNRVNGPWPWELAFSPKLPFLFGSDFTNLVFPNSFLGQVFLSFGMPFMHDQFYNTHYCLVPFSSISISILVVILLQSDN